MATLAPTQHERAPDDRFFLTTALVMAAIMVAGFSTQLAAGRSSFASPVIVHAHAVVFFGWVTIFVVQTALAARGSMVLHRLLGWLACGWAIAMVAIGVALMLHVVRGATVPFFFQPQYFFVANLLALVGFAGLTCGAVAMRRQTDWHRRLHVSAMAVLLGPAFGRLLPMPFIIPWSYQIAALAGAVVLLIAAAIDARRTGQFHWAWGVGLGATLATLLAAQVIGFSSLGGVLYRAATAGSPGANVAALAFPAPPSGPQVTGR